MKKFRKIMAVLVAAMMIISSMTWTVFADDYTITVENGINGQNYYAYKVFDVTLDDVASVGVYDRFAYTIDSSTNPFWSTLISGASTSSDPTTYTSSTYGLVFTKVLGSDIYNVTIDPAQTQAQVQLLATNLRAVVTDSTAKAGSITTYDDGSVSAVNKTMTVNALGYYLIDSTQGALCSLDTTTTNVTVYEKNTKPTLTKGVREDESTITVGQVTSTANAAATADASATFGAIASGEIGQVMKYKLVVNTGTDPAYSSYTDDEAAIGTGINNVLTIEDELPAGMVFEGATQASGGQLVAATDSSQNLVVTGDGTAWTLGTDYYVTYANDMLTITLVQASVANLGINKDIVIYYGARIDDDAVIGGNGNKNSATLKYYGDGNTTPLYSDGPKEAIVYVDAVALLKYGPTAEKIAGAKFSMAKSSGDAMYFVRLNAGGTGNNSALYQYSQKFTASGANVTVGGTQYSTTDTIETPASGSVVIIGLDEETYTLTETEAPDGYYQKETTFTVDAKYADVALANNVTRQTVKGSTATFTKGENDTISGTNYKLNGESVSMVENKSSAELPSTGGMGTTVLYIVGGMLVILAGAYLFFSRKKTA